MEPKTWSLRWLLRQGKPGQDPRLPGQKSYKDNTQTQRASTPCLRRLAAASGFEQQRLRPHAQRSAEHESQRQHAETYQQCYDLQQTATEATINHQRYHQTPSLHRRGGITNVTPGTKQLAQGTKEVNDAIASPPVLSSMLGSRGGWQTQATLTDIYDELATAFIDFPLNARGFVSPTPRAKASQHTDQEQHIAHDMMITTALPMRTMQSGQDNNNNPDPQRCATSQLTTSKQQHEATHAATTKSTTTLEYYRYDVDHRRQQHRTIPAVGA